MFSISKNPQASMAEVLAKVEKYINGEEPSYPREEGLQPTRRKAGLTSNGSEALRDKKTERDPQEGTENDPQRVKGASETA